MQYEFTTKFSRLVSIANLDWLKCLLSLQQADLVLLDPLDGELDWLFQSSPQDTNVITSLCPAADDPNIKGLRLFLEDTVWINPYWSSHLKVEEDTLERANPCVSQLISSNLSQPSTWANSEVTVNWLCHLWYSSCDCFVYSKPTQDHFYTVKTVS